MITASRHYNEKPSCKIICAFSPALLFSNPRSGSISGNSDRVSNGKSPEKESLSSEESSTGKRSKEKELDGKNTPALIPQCVNFAEYDLMALISSRQVCMQVRGLRRPKSAQTAPKCLSFSPKKAILPPPRSIAQSSALVTSVFQYHLVALSVVEPHLEAFGDFDIHLHVTIDT
jgi:hypothetical protein